MSPRYNTCPTYQFNISQVTVRSPPQTMCVSHRKRQVSPVLHTRLPQLLASSEGASRDGATEKGQTPSRIWRISCLLLELWYKKTRFVKMPLTFTKPGFVANTQVQPYHASKSDAESSIGCVIRHFTQRSNVISPSMSLSCHAWLNSNQGPVAHISRRAALGLETFSTQTRTTVAEATARNGVWSHCRLMPSVP